jgi:hypothetical protein
MDGMDDGWKEQTMAGHKCEIQETLKVGAVGKHASGAFNVSSGQSALAASLADLY